MVTTYFLIRQGYWYTGVAFSACNNAYTECMICVIMINDRYEYQWCDGVEYKRPTALPAQQYIGLLMEWVETQINNEDIFPVSVGVYYIMSPR